MKSNRSAVTLAELIISTVLVSMVLAGVFSAQYALERINKDSSSGSHLGIQARAIAETIRDSVSRVHDNFTVAASGIDLTIPDTICFRHDALVAPGPAYTPENYLDDMWICYTLIVTKLYRCERGAALPCDDTDTLMGNVVNNQLSEAAIRPNLVRNAASGDYYFEMTVVVREDPIAGVALDATDVPTAGTRDNPQAAITFRQSPAGF